MGVKFGREYDDIVRDLSTAIKRVEDFYDFFQMNEHDWHSLDAGQQDECVRTLADDVFYALGQDRSLEIGAGRIQYIKNKHIIKVQDGDNVVTVVKLI